MRSIEVSFHVKMRDYTTIGIGGAADRVAFPRSPAEVREILAAERRAGRPVHFLGAGSNLLVSDGGVAGTVVCTKKNLSKVVFLSDGSVVAEAGVMLPRLAVLCALSGLSGMEPLSGIPGTAGGALTMNAGAFGRRIGELTEWVEVADGAGEIHRIEARAIRFGYRRRSTLCRASWSGRLPVRRGHAGVRVRRDAANEREAPGKTALGEKTFGSTFRNPPGAEARPRCSSARG